MTKLAPCRLLAGLAPAARWAASASAHVSRALHAVGGAFDKTVLLLRARPRRRPPLAVGAGAAGTAVAAGGGPGHRAVRPGAAGRGAHVRRARAQARTPPVLWLVVEPAAEALPTAQLLRGAGVAYRHHQRNLALEHMEEHRLAGPDDVYDLRFFDQLRQIRSGGSMAGSCGLPRCSPKVKRHEAGCLR
ncbi:hypothetical protein ZWY2020_007076 [Hordeum vulgare]|nr:hypothetical protein ZWY2020_007076 [Hordeum vulgare]